MNKALLFPLLLAAACGAPGTVVVDSDCARAAAHVAACTGVASVAPPSCDANAAAQLLATPCDKMGQTMRSAESLGDPFAAIACAAGVVRYCPALVCDAPSYPSLSTVCADYIAVAGCGGCGFYACREAAGHCGDDGYYVAFAEKYCNRFLLTLRPRMSPAGQRFLDVARDCLMRFVDSELLPDDACADVKQRAFASHVGCYHDNGFCELPLSDRWLLVNAVDPADIDWLAALRTSLSCL
jgi:hypothetical protein